MGLLWLIRNRRISKMQISTPLKRIPFPFTIVQIYHTGTSPSTLARNLVFSILQPAMKTAHLQNWWNILFAHSIRRIRTHVLIFYRGLLWCHIAKIYPTGCYKARWLRALLIFFHKSILLWGVSDMRKLLCFFFLLFICHRLFNCLHRPQCRSSWDPCTLFPFLRGVLLSGLNRFRTPHYA